MRVEALRLRAAAGAVLCCAALALGAPGCTQGGGGAASQSQPFLPGPPTPQTATPTPAPSPAIKGTLPASRGFVNDFANVIDERTEKTLEARLVRLKANAKIEFAVVTVETTGEDSIFDYSLALARAWGIGPPAGEEGGGLLLLLATKDRQWRLQVSRSLEADLPDEAADKIGRTMGPSLRAERYGEAVTKCADALIKHLADRRGFTLNDGELILQGLPEEKPTPTPRRKP